MRSYHGQQLPLTKGLTVMFSLLLILVLPVLAASLGSWLFSQWLSEQRRASAVTIGIGGMGLVLLLGASAAHVTPHARA